VVLPAPGPETTFITLVIFPKLNININIKSLMIYNK